MLFATDTTSADADYDNGVVALYGAPRYGRADERATHRLARPARRQMESVLAALRLSPARCVGLGTAALLGNVGVVSTLRPLQRHQGDVILLFPVLPNEAGQLVKEYVD